MEAKELRIGNLYFLDGNVSEVESLYDNCINLDYCEGDIVYEGKQEPIPLTEEWMLKFGFEDDYLPERYSDLGPVNCMKFGRISLSYQDWKYFPVRKYDNIQHIAYGIGINYVHQLQNLYFALRGEELTIKDKL